VNHDGESLRKVIETYAALTDRASATELQSEIRANVRGAAREASANASASEACNVVIHLRRGGSVRGQVSAFPPKQDPIPLQLSAADGGELQSVAWSEVFAMSRQPPRKELPVGPNVEIRMVNDRTVQGITPDYQSGGAALTVVGFTGTKITVELWLPAKSVKSLRQI
jgi:hypothetical protein